VLGNADYAELFKKYIFANLIFPVPELVEGYEVKTPSAASSPCEEGGGKRVAFFSPSTSSGTKLSLQLARPISALIIFNIHLRNLCPKSQTLCVPKARSPYGIIGKAK